LFNLDDNHEAVPVEAIAAQLRALGLSAAAAEEYIHELTILAGKLILAAEEMASRAHRALELLEKGRSR
jgi:hypothetical protein